MKQLIKYLKVAAEYAALFTVAAEALKLILSRLEGLFPEWFQDEPQKPAFTASASDQNVSPSKPHFETTMPESEVTE